VHTTALEIYYAVVRIYCAIYYAVIRIYCAIYYAVARIYYVAPWPYKVLICACHTIFL